MEIGAPIKLECRGCGASLEFNAGVQALTCVYCKTVNPMPASPAAAAGSPRFIVPMKLTEQAIKDAAREFLAEGDYTPDDLVDAPFLKVERLYVPAFRYRGHYDARWTASFGYDRTEPYVDYETRYVDGRSERVPVTRYRTVTDWQPASGSDVGDFTLYGYAGDVLDDDDQDIVHDHSGADSAIPFDANYTAGYECAPFTAQDKQVYEEDVKDRVDDLIDDNIREHAQGDHQRDWDFNASIRTDNDSILLPVGHVVYEFDGERYDIWVDGCDADNVVGDEPPEDSARQSAVALGFAPALLGTIGLPLAGHFMRGDIFATFGNGYYAPLFVLAAWVFGIVRRSAILDYSSRLRDSRLALHEAGGGEAEVTAEDMQPPAQPLLAMTELDIFVLPLLIGALAWGILTQTRHAPVAVPPAAEISQPASVVPASAPIDTSTSILAAPTEEPVVDSTDDAPATPAPHHKHKHHVAAE